MKTTLIRQIDIAGAQAEHAEEILRREWLLTNGLGGYASGTISGVVSRRYHGLLIAALPAPHGRTVMLNHLAENLLLPNGRVAILGGAGDSPSDRSSVREFRLEVGLPVWVYEAEGFVIEKRVLLIHGQNTVHVTFRLLSQQDAASVELRPSLHFHPHERNLGAPLGSGYSLHVRERRYEIAAETLPFPLRLFVHDPDARFIYESARLSDLHYEKEAERGYPATGTVWRPGAFSVQLRRDYPVTLVASTEDWPTILAVTPDDAMAGALARRQRLLDAAVPSVRTGPAAELVLAADQFLIQPAARVEDAARVRAQGDEVRTVIAGYHWFTDWGRDTMISLEGLTLTTGRHQEAGWILRTFAHYVRDGLIPNLFPEGEREGLYHTADATLWYFHALDRYLAVTGDHPTLTHLLPKLVEIAEHHLRGTHFGIGVDPADGLLRQGAEGYQLTWMDAKVDDWVVTPRRGKAVEVNALWYNALRLLECWLRETGENPTANRFAEHAARTRSSFNRRFWSEDLGCLLDIVDGEKGDDPACRPNQVLAIALRHPVLEETRWPAVLAKVQEELLTSVGLRSLAPGHPDYQRQYFGDLRARDAAYHQGTVWAWLIGPFIDAWLKVHPADQAGARRFLDGLVAHLDRGCVGSIAEIFDAEEPYTARGCIAQAWSVAEALRCWAKTAAGEGR